MKGALSDRLYADAVAAVLEQSQFLLGSTDIALDEVAAHAKARGDLYADDLSVTRASIEHGCRHAEKRWREDACLAAPLAASSNAPIRQRCLSLLTSVAGRLLAPSGRETVLRVDRDEPGREILRWRYLSLTMPPSILLAASAARSGRYPGPLRLLNASMAPDGPVAHQHLHHAASPSFEDLWALVKQRVYNDPADLRRSVRDKKAKCPGLHRGSCPRHPMAVGTQDTRAAVEHARHMDGWADTLSQAVAALDLLSRHAGHADDLAECPDEYCRLGRASLQSFMNGEASRPGAGRYRLPWRHAGRSVARRYWHANAEGVFRRSPATRRSLLQDGRSMELADLTRAFAHAQPWRVESSDQVYDRLLLQYLRVKCALFRLLVHGPGERGLVRFLEHFSQIKVYEPRSDRLRPTKPVEPGLDVRSTEYRLAPDAWLREIARERFDQRRARSIEDRDADEQAGEAAWLIHFKRAPSGRRVPLYGRQIREMNAEARQVGNALEQDPRRLLRLRGIDICGVEERQPLWVSAETLRRLRTRSSDIAARRTGLHLQPLRLTLHAGEDFRWLTSGTRAVAEPFLWRLIERGDRIGHGIGITLKAGPWWRRHHGEVVSTKLIDRLLDLAFLATYTEGDDRSEAGCKRSFSKGRTSKQDDWLRSKVVSTAKALDLPIGCDDDAAEDPVHVARAFWKALGGGLTRRLLGRRNPPGNGALLHERWLHAYLWSRNVQRRSEQELLLPVDETTWPERDLLRTARLRLVREVARWQVPIETNPSSNLVVAGLDALASQDFLAQTIHKKRSSGRETIPWTISTDDPITFATTLADEYAYAWAGMVLRDKNPYDPAHARALLDQAADTSMRTRFTLPELPSSARPRSGANRDV